MHDQQYGTMHCLVISTLPAYDSDDSALTVRVTLTSKAHNFPGWVRLNSGDPVGGYAVTHDLDRVDPDELKEDLGELSLDTLVKVRQALRRMIDV
jgi:mRNA-degrading endonuclease toxin of MazEF toxin-antitoxin module